MNESYQRRVLSATIAFLIPLTVDPIMQMIGSSYQIPQLAIFCYAIAVGALLITSGIKTCIPALSKGLFFGGILTIIYNYYLHSQVLNFQINMLFLVSGLSIAVLISLRNCGILKGMGSSKRKSIRRKK